MDYASDGQLFQPRFDEDPPYPELRLELRYETSIPIFTGVFFRPGRITTRSNDEAFPGTARSRY